MKKNLSDSKKERTRDFLEVMIFLLNGASTGAIVGLLISIYETEIGSGELIGILIPLVGASLGFLFSVILLFISKLLKSTNIQTSSSLRGQYLREWFRNWFAKLKRRNGVSVFTLGTLSGIAVFVVVISGELSSFDLKNADEILSKIREFISSISIF